MLACAYPSFDRPMILFQNIVEILHRSMLAILLKGTFGFEPHDRKLKPPSPQKRASSRARNSSPRWGNTTKN